MHRSVLPLLVSLMLPLAPSSAHAQSGINLSFDDCGAFGVALKTSTCSSNVGAAMLLYASVLPPETIPHMFGAEGVLDVYSGSAGVDPMPAWWQLGSTGCRANAWAVGEDFVAGPFHCADYWQGQAVGAWGVVPFAADPSRVRMKFLAALATEQPLVPVETYLFRIAVLNLKTAGAGACAGCDAATCLQLEELKLVQPVGIGDFRINTPLANTRVYFQAQCLIRDPVLNRTWGEIKAQYR